MKEVKVFQKDGMFIPIKAIRGNGLEERLKEKHTHHFYNEKACKDCDNAPERPNDICERCEGYGGCYQLANVMQVGDNKYLKVPIGSWPATAATLASKNLVPEVVDKSPRKKIAPIKFLGTFREGQKDAIKAILKKKRGVIMAPPRSGKTVSSTAAICIMGRKTLILASQKDWLMGFKETFIGSKTQKALTDLDPKRIKLCKKFEDFRDHDICLATVQTFYSESGQKLLQKIKSMFQVIIGDEIHFGAADRFLQILASFNVYVMIGLTATPDLRKDGKYILIREIVGPIIYEVKVEREQPTIRLTRTAFKTKGRSTLWAHMVSSLENDKKRQRVIAEQCLKDVEAGHMVFIPFAQVKPIASMVQLINRLAGRNIAHPFTGKQGRIREELVQKARDYKIKVLVGQLRILSTGINIPRASALYEVTMSSNKQNAEQRFARVLTKYKNKPKPIIRYFLDDSGVRRSCMRNEYFQVMVPKFKPLISEQTYDTLTTYFKGSGSNGRRNHDF